MQLGGKLMFRFSGEHCPVCGKAFSQQDDIVVCPDCGTPHHRECWFENGVCANAEKHGGFEWKPSGEAKPAEEEKLGHICSVCGSNNPPDNLFCENCGHPRNVKEEPHRNPYAKNTDLPFDGAEIDGVSAREMAQFINTGAYTYIPKFISKKHGGWNWAAFFFAPFWFFFRKLPRIGAALLIITISLNFLFLTPMSEFVTATSDVMASVTDEETGAIRQDLTEQEANEAYTALISVFQSRAARLTYLYFALSAVISTLCGAFANRIYKAYCVKQINLIKKAELENPAERAVLTARKGGVSFLGVGIAILARQLVFTIVSILIL